jgi:hypothetical protein
MGRVADEKVTKTIIAYVRGQPLWDAWVAARCWLSEQ